MSREVHSESQDESRSDPARPRGFPKTAWTVVVLLVLASVFLQGQKGKEQLREYQGTIQHTILDVQGQYLVAAAQVPGMQKGQLYDSAKSLNAGPPSMRLRFVVLAGELVGPEEAVKQVRAVESKWAAQDAHVSKLDQRVATVLGSLYTDYQAGQWDAPSLESSDHQLLMDELGWFGALALSPKPSGAAGADLAGTDATREQVLAPAWRTFVVVILAFLSMLSLGALGLAGAITFLVLVVKRKVRSAILTGSGNSAIYAETFAAWMVLFFVLNVAASLIVHKLPNSQLLVSSAASVLSLGALLWPAARGVPWCQVRRDIGLTLGDRPIREIFWGVVCYVSNLPVLIIGVLATLVLMGIYSAVTGSSGGLEPMQAPTHPVVEWATDAGWLGRLQIFLLACVVAPIIEEIVFRGVLYRHLREGTCRWPAGASIAFSLVFTSLIFAVIHPQGLIAVPALMAVATGLTLAREWRGSLVASIVMHATNNGLVMLLLFSLI